MTSIILAGGRSKRLGKNKILEKLGGQTLIERVVDCLAPISEQIIIVTVPDQELPSFHYPVEIVRDIYPESGALGGLHGGLKASHTFHSLIVAVDMPFLNQRLLAYMMEIAVNYDVVIPRVGELIEPLHAIYSKNCIEPIETMIKSGKLSIRNILPQVKVHYVEGDELGKFDPKHLSFFNINTAIDLEKAKQLLMQR